MKLKLYVSGPPEGALWNKALEVCDLIAECELLMIDVNEHPDEASEDMILSTPTLLLEGPIKRRVVGEFKDARAVATYLTLPEW